jgi:hypothetical protein
MLYVVSVVTIMVIGADIGMHNIVGCNHGQRS